MVKKFQTLFKKTQMFILYFYNFRDLRDRIKFNQENLRISRIAKIFKKKNLKMSKKPPFVVIRQILDSNFNKENFFTKKKRNDFGWNFTFLTSKNKFSKSPTFCTKGLNTKRGF